jgi:iron complex transport system ATP-binding protein
MLQIQGVSKKYGGNTVLEHIEFSVRKGEFFAILGPNGSGKSTLLKLISGAEKPDAGQLKLEGKPLSVYSPKQLSRMLAVLLQESLPAVDFTAREVVEMGRYPYQNWLGEENGDAGALVDEILEELGLKHLQNRSLRYLSGGERQRVALGKVMAQQPRLLLLDEPTTYLDIGYQIQMMDLVMEWRRQTGLTVVAVLHDLNLASIYCDRLLLLSGGKIRAIGTPEEVIRSDLIQHVYGTRPIVVEHPVHHLPQIMLQQGRNVHESVETDH